MTTKDPLHSIRTCPLHMDAFVLSQQDPVLGMTQNTWAQISPQVRETLRNSASGPAGNLRNTEEGKTRSNQGTQQRWQPTWVCSTKDNVGKVTGSRACHPKIGPFGDIDDFKVVILRKKKLRKNH